MVCTYDIPIVLCVEASNIRNVFSEDKKIQFLLLNFFSFSWYRSMHRMIEKRNNHEIVLKIRIFFYWRYVLAIFGFCQISFSILSQFTIH